MLVTADGFACRGLMLLNRTRHGTSLASLVAAHLSPSAIARIGESGFRTRYDATRDSEAIRVGEMTKRPLRRERRAAFTFARSTLLKLLRSGVRAAAKDVVLTEVCPPGVDVARYLNYHEDPGGLSLALGRDAIDGIQRATVPLPEAFHDGWVRDAAAAPEDATETVASATG